MFSVACGRDKGKDMKRHVLSQNALLHAAGARRENSHIGTGGFVHRATKPFTFNYVQLAWCIIGLNSLKLPHALNGSFDLFSVITK